jgi:hypothetical protein
MKCIREMYEDSPLCAQMTPSWSSYESFVEASILSCLVILTLSRSPDVQQTSAKRSLALVKRLFKSFRQVFVASTWQARVEKGLRSESAVAWDFVLFFIDVLLDVDMITSVS